MSSLAQLLPILAVVLLLYFLVIRPARRRAQKVSQLQAALSLGDEVMLTSGIYGAVTSVEDDRVQVAVADGVVLTVHRGAIAEIVRDVPKSDETPFADAGTLEAGGPSEADGRPEPQFDAQHGVNEDVSRDVRDDVHQDTTAAHQADSQETDPSATDNTTRGAN